MVKASGRDRDALRCREQIRNICLRARTLSALEKYTTREIAWQAIPHYGQNASLVCEVLGSKIPSDPPTYAVRS